MQKENEKLLNAIYKNCKMAIQSIETLLSDVEDEEFKAEISKQNSEYIVVCKECEMLAKANDLKIKDNNIIEKATLWTNIKINTITDKSCKHFAEMMFLGTNMGIPTLTFAICDCAICTEEVLLLAKKLLKMEEEFAERIKKYFCRR